MSRGRVAEWKAVDQFKPAGIFGSHRSQLVAGGLDVPTYLPSGLEG